MRVWAQLDWLARVLVPLTITVALVVLGIVPLPLPYFHSMGSGLATIAVYYWAIHAPHLLRAPLVFAVGLVGDALGMAPLGVGTLVLLLVYGLVLSQRRLLVGAPFVVVWWGYMVTGAGAGLILWLLSSFTAGTLIDPTLAAFAYLWSLGAYPLVAFLLALAQRVLPREAA